MRDSSMQCVRVVRVCECRGRRERSAQQRSRRRAGQDRSLVGCPLPGLSAGQGWVGMERATAS